MHFADDARTDSDSEAPAARDVDEAPWRHQGAVGRQQRAVDGSLGRRVAWAWLAGEGIPAIVISVAGP